MSQRFPLFVFFLLLFSSGLLAQANMNRANKQYELFAFKEASKLYHKVLQEDADNVEALSKLGDCYFHLNQLTEAREWFEKGIKKRGFEYTFMLNYAHTLMGLGDYDSARQWFLLYGEGFPEIGQHFAKACEIAKQRVIAPSAYEISGSEVNSFRSDFGPAFFGDVVVLSSFYNRIKGENPNQANKNILFLSAKDKNGKLQKPSNYFSNNLTNYYGVGPVSFSADGKWVAYTKNNFEDGTRQNPSSGVELSLYIAEVSPSGQWKNAIAFPFNGSGYSTGYPTLSPDGNTLYFASNRVDGLGGYDIYVSNKNAGEWSFPTNLGAPVNSPGDEISPFYTGKTLYFSSNWHHGFGGFDVFRAEQGAGNWAKIFHQGTGINSSRDDYGFIYDEVKNIGFFTSNRVGGKGLEDIYRVGKSSEKYLVQVVDEATKSAISGATIDFTDCGQRIVQTDEKGQFAFQVSGLFDCEATVALSGYATQKVKVKSKGLDGVNRIEVSLKSTGNKESFVGRVIQAGTSLPLEGVVITASHLRSQSSSQVISDAQGYYSLLLELNQNYTIKFSKASFTEIQRSVNSGSGVDKSILDITSLMSSSTSIPVSSNDTSTTKTDDSLPPVISPSAVPDVTIAAEPTSPTKSGDSNLTTGYSIQIAAIPANKPFDKSRYANAEKIGRMYIKEDGKYKRIRIGIYATKAEADAVKKQLGKIGYTKAYVVNESGNSAPVVRSTNTPSSPPSSPASTSSAAQYFVRLGAFRDASNFDDNGLDVYGDFVNYSKGEFTIVLINAGTKIGRARVIREKAKEKGFKGAYVVQKKEGKYVKI